MARWQTQLTSVIIVVFAAHAQSTSAAQKKSATKATQVKPAQSREQVIQVNGPYCDAYLPSQIDGSNVTLLLGKDATASQVTGFLGHSYTTTDSIPKKGPFFDPGFPILGNPADHLQSNGSDLTRLITRLTYPKQTPLCQGLEANPDQLVPRVAESQYFLVHIVRWEIAKDGGYKYTADNSQWYVFNRSDPKEAHREVPFTFHPLVSSDMRMFGSKNVFFVGIHLAPKNSYAGFREDLGISYKMSVQKIEPINWQDLKAVLSVYGIGGAAAGAGAGGAAAGGAGLARAIRPECDPVCEYMQLLQGTVPVGVYGAASLTGLTSLPVQITASLNVNFKNKITPSDDVPVYCLGGFWEAVQCDAPPSGGARGAPAAPARTQPTTTAGSSPTPSTTTKSTGCVQSAGPCSDSQTVQNEGLYWWDAGVGVPFNSYKDLQVSNGSVTVKTLSKKTAYGFLILAPWGEDFVTPPSLGIPHFMIGIPFTGKVLDSPIFALGESVNLSKIGVSKTISQFVSMFRFYAGLNENKTFGTATTPGAEPPHRWIGKLQYGIEFSIKDVASKLGGGN